MTKWYEDKAVETSPAVQGRMRLVRNVKGYRFPETMQDTDRTDLLNRLRSIVKSVMFDEDEEYSYYALEELGEKQRRMFAENRIYNQSVAQLDRPMGLFLDAAESRSVLLGANDHIRLQIQLPGFDTGRMWSWCAKSEERLSEKLDFAFDEKYGYLTAFPTNAGTALRVSAILHLPMLARSKNFEDIISEMGRLGAAVRGIYMDGTENFAALYEISNHKTLGVSEQEIIDLVKSVTDQLCARERACRDKSYGRHMALEDEIYKSYGVLKYARRLTQRDAMMFLSGTMQGVEDGILKNVSVRSVYSLIMGIQTEALDKFCRSLEKNTDMDMARAQYIRQELDRHL